MPNDIQLVCRIRGEQLNFTVKYDYKPNFVGDVEEFVFVASFDNINRTNTTQISKLTAEFK
ncbi:unnamed protein product [Strongylus vulgaris]|uniref:Uncharacterized protein n=1 Tax=Strongylus vulgaris TaxID=40348 RepID=A0A3P7L9G4_STRVU|nr:unnamed protein product [Strongylus vulgaris]